MDNPQPPHDREIRVGFPKRNHQAILSKLREQMGEVFWVMRTDNSHNGTELEIAVKTEYLKDFHARINQLILET